MSRHVGPLRPATFALGLCALLMACAGDDGGRGSGTSLGATAGTTATSSGGSSAGSGSAGDSSATGTSGSAGSSSAGTGTSAGTTGSGGSTTDSGGGTTGMGTTGGGSLEPPAGGSSGGSGGGAASGEVRTTDMGNVTYRVIAPAGAGPHPAMIVYSGTEGGAAMTSNLSMVKDFAGLGDVVFGVLDGVTYNGDAQAGALVLDQLRADYDIDNDRTYLLSESAGTSAGLQLALSLRQSYFAAYWANDVNAQASPQLDAAALGFAPWGNAGPGGNFADANAIVSSMMGKGYRFDGPSPYDGPGAGTHGSTEQFVAAMQWFAGKSRQ